MDRMDMLDMSVFAFQDGNAWAKQMLHAEMEASLGEYDFSEYPLLATVVDSPERLRTHTVPRGGMRLPMGDAFMDVMSRAPESAMARYDALRALARRFGPGANDWILRRELSAVGFTRREDAAPRDTEGLQLPLAQDGDRRFSIFNLDENLAPSIVDFMLDIIAKSGKAESAGDILFFNLDAGFAAAIAPGISLLSPDADRTSFQLSSIFGGDLHGAPHIALSRKAGDEAVGAILPRNLAGYSIYTYLEPFVRSVTVQRDRVLIDIDAVERPANDPLFYEYSHGAYRRGAKSPDGVYWRTEIPVDSTFGESDVFGNIAGVIRAHGDGANMYIEGSLGTAGMNGWCDVGSAMGFDPWTVDLVATGPAAQSALTVAISALSSLTAVMG
jgi:hypothetical protein